MTRVKRRRNLIHRFDSGARVGAIHTLLAARARVRLLRIAGKGLRAAEVLEVTGL